MMKNKQNTHGGARAGAGRKRKGEEARRTTLAISGTKSEIETIKNFAKSENKSVSRFIIDLILSK